MTSNLLPNNQHPMDSNELTFTTFSDLCRFCSLRIGPKIHLFEKEAEQRQILYKVRSFLPIAVSFYPMHCSVQMVSLKEFLFSFYRFPKTTLCRRKSVTDALQSWNNCTNGEQFVCRVILCFEIMLIR